MGKMSADDGTIDEGVVSVIAAGRADDGWRWRQSLPVLRGAAVTLREPEHSDAAALFSTVSTELVSRFMSSPPDSVDGFEQFIAWAHAERSAGRLLCFAVVPHGLERPVGIFQLRRLDVDFQTAEWGFAIGSDFWNSGVYLAAAELVLEFAFDVVGVHRLEARAALDNGRGNGALRKVGAARSGILIGSLSKNGRCYDQAVWTILEEDWRRTRLRQVPGVH